MRVRLAAILAALILAGGMLATGTPTADAGVRPPAGSFGNSLVIMPMASSGTHSARIRHRSDSAVSSIRACKDAASSSRCASGSATTYLSRNETTPEGDWDGYWCPTGRTCRTYFGPFYISYGPISSGPRFVKVSGCAGCTKSVRVM